MNFVFDFADRHNALLVVSRGKANLICKRSDSCKRIINVVIAEDTAWGNFFSVFW